MAKGKAYLVWDSLVPKRKHYWKRRKEKRKVSYPNGRTDAQKERFLAKIKDWCQNVKICAEKEGFKAKRKGHCLKGRFNDQKEGKVTKRRIGSQKD